MTVKQAGISAVRSAGSILKKTRIRTIHSMKGTHDILTDADLRSERRIIHTIRDAFPEHGIFSEEAGMDGVQSAFQWIVDPLDGTINFSRDIDEYCVSLALDYEKATIFSAVYRPVDDKLFCSEKEKQTTVNGKKIFVSLTPVLIEALLATDNSGSNLEARKKNFALIADICVRVRHVRVFGSTALHLARIAKGELDCFLKSSVNYWDVAAGVFLIRQSGGRVTDFEGREFTRESKTILASNALVHDELLFRIKKMYG